MERKLEEFWTAAALAKALGITEEELMRLAYTKGLPYIRLGRKKVLFKESSVIGWLDGLEKASDESGTTEESH